MYTDVLEAARLLPGEEQRRLAAELLGSPPAAGTADRLAAVEATHGSMKLPDLETLRWLAEDKQL
jgi:hypothetical protein